MKTCKSLLVAIALLLPISAYAQGLVPTMDREFEFCKDRPVEPDWLDNLPPREASKGMLIQMIYRFQSAKDVTTTGECSCATRFPTWDDAIQRYNDTYLGADENDHREAIGAFRAQYSALRPSARSICEEVGHW